MKDFQQIQNKVLKVDKDGNQITLRDLQLIQVEILVELKRICQKRNIEYFLEAGTLLGAIRHKGFIPWDDDLDISIYRENYEKLVKALKEELDQTRFQFHCLEVNRKHNITGPAIKVKRKGTYSLEPHNFIVNRSGQNNLFVDIFVYDDCGEYNFRMKFYRFLSKFSSYFNVFMDTIGLSFKWIKKGHVHLARRYAKKYPNSNNFCSRLTWSYTKSWIYKKSDFFPLIDVDFEGIKVPVPHNYDSVLKEHYGNYMSYPKASQMKFRHIRTKELKIDKDILEKIKSNRLYSKE